MTEHGQIKGPRSPRRYQAELDAARHAHNITKRELEQVRSERRFLAARLQEAVKAIRKLADVHHRTLANSKLHDPKNRDWTECDCNTCKLAQSVIETNNE